MTRGLPHLALFAARIERDYGSCSENANLDVTS